MGLGAGGTILTFHQVSDFEECWNRRWHSSAASGKLGDDQQAMQGEAGQGRETRRGGLLQVPVVSATNNDNIEFLLVVINVIVINTHIIQPGSKKLDSVLNVILDSKC